MNNNPAFGKRLKKNFLLRSVQEGIQKSQEAFSNGNHFEAFDIIEYMVDNFPAHSIDVLEFAYELYKLLPNRTRYFLYQGRVFNFDIKPGAKVLDIGSGHLPFHMATHLADFAVEDNYYGRDGAPFKYIEGKPVYQCSVEEMPFEDKEFDFVYCSHVLEHTQFPEKACEELMRIAKRGYIETPTKAKDLWLNSAKASNHLWSTEFRNGVLSFTEYTKSEIEGIGSGILMDMHVAPQTKREKAFSALLYLKPESVNTMVLWDSNINYKVKRNNDVEKVEQQKLDLSSNFKSEITLKDKLNNDPLTFLQVHTFYSNYLEDVYTRTPNLLNQSYNIQINYLLEDGFSAIHLFSPYLKNLGYKSELIIANNRFSQQQWLKEHTEVQGNFDFNTLLKAQIEYYKPDVLYLSDPITFDSKFVRTLSYKPKLIIGWRAADIPQGTDWSEFDILLSGLSGIRDAALKIGAKSALNFFPGFISSFLPKIKDIKPSYDVSFCGSWTLDQHSGRNEYIHEIAQNALTNNYSCAFYLSGQTNLLTPEVKKFNHEPAFGVNMLKAIKSGKITFDSRGLIRNLSQNGKDLALNETMNMRIFEAAGAGVFLLTEEYDNLKDFFIPGHEVETFRDKKELIDKIRYYSVHNEERELIAKRAQEKCLTQFSIEKRAEEFDKIIRDYFSKKTDNKIDKINSTTSSEDEKTIAHISDLISKKEISSAMELIINLKLNYKRLENLDTLRGLCFMQINDNESAKQSFLEELVSFPDNQIAKNLLSSIKDSPAHPLLNDSEFKELVKQVRPYTMMSIERLYSLYTNAMNICKNNIPGNFVECGVARGGSSVLLGLVIKKYSSLERKLFSFDTYEGMPAPTESDKHAGINADATGWGTGTCYGSWDNINNLCKQFGLENIIVPVKGLFQDTLPVTKHKISNIAFLHMDGDWYESTKSILENIYDQVIDNGFIQVDDFGHWEGCRKAIEEFEKNNNIVFNKKVIDGTGVSFFKPHDNISSKDLICLNLGCGRRFHEKWINIDFVSSHEKVVQYDLSKGIPLDDNSVDVVYHSHLLEHFPKNKALGFIKECYRVLKPSGIIRVVVPDLEQIVLNYIELLNKSLTGDKTAQYKYEWIMLEMFDQMVRNYSGGDMLKYWQQERVPAKDFVIARMGSEAKNYLFPVKSNQQDILDPNQIGKFRLSGEIHQWMYDRFSLGKLMAEAGFKHLDVLKACQSKIKNFNSFLLDIEEDGSVRKPDSLFMEGVK